MAKGPIVTPEVEALIASVYRKHPKWKAPEIRNTVEGILREKNPKLPKDWPGLSSVQKVLAKVRRKAKELPVDAQEKPWSMATLDQYPISPQAIPTVLKVWKYRAENRDSFTIREAKWAARLSNVITDTAALSAKADEYGRIEQLFQLIDQPFNSLIMDGTLMGLDIHKFEREALGYSLQDAYWSNIMPLVATQWDAIDQAKEVKQGKRDHFVISADGTRDKKRGYKKDERKHKAKRQK